MTTDQKPRQGGDDPMIRRVCATCEFQVLEQMQGQIKRQMVCHRFPPTVSMATTPQGIQGMTLFPIVQPQMWCHEWSPKPEESATETKDDTPGIFRGP